MAATFNHLRTPIDMATWPRKSVYEFFSAFTEPFHGICLRLDCTATRLYARAHHIPVFIPLLQRALTASMLVENLRLRIVDGAVWRYEFIHGGCVVARPNNTIGFTSFPYQPTIVEQYQTALPAIERTRARLDLERTPMQNLIRFSSLPWLDFTDLSHARNFAFADSAPRITFGKITENNGRFSMPVSINVHHALVDGLHLGLFFEHFERLLDNPEATQ